MLVRWDMDAADCNLDDSPGVAFFLHREARLLEPEQHPKETALSSLFSASHPVPLVVATLALTLSACASAPDSGFTNPSHGVRRLGDGTPLVYVVMGDSTAAGQGAPYEQGIASSTARELARTHSVAFTNLGISGARAADVVRDQLGEARALHPDLVLLSLGANDVTHLTPIGSQRRNLETIIDGLRTSNPKVVIVVTGSPDMGSPPRIPRLLRGLAGRRTRSVNEMYLTLVREKRLTFAPIAEETGPVFRADPTLFDSDRFHPNTRGYALWTTVLNRALRDALGKRP